MFNIRGRELNIFLAFIIKSYFAVPKNIKLNSTPYFMIKIPNKQKLQNLAVNNLLDIDYESLSKKAWDTLASDNYLRFFTEDIFIKNTKNNNDNWS